MFSPVEMGAVGSPMVPGQEYTTLDTPAVAPPPPPRRASTAKERRESITGPIMATLASIGGMGGRSESSLSSLTDYNEDEVVEVAQRSPVPVVDPVQVLTQKESKAGASYMRKRKTRALSDEDEQMDPANPSGKRSVVLWHRCPSAAVPCWSV